MKIFFNVGAGLLVACTTTKTRQSIMSTDAVASCSIIQILYVNFLAGQSLAVAIFPRTIANVTGVVLGSGALVLAIQSANTMAHAVGTTFSSNVGWFFLVATVALIIGIIRYIMRRLSNLA